MRLALAHLSRFAERESPKSGTDLRAGLRAVGKICDFPPFRIEREEMEHGICGGLSRYSVSGLGRIMSRIIVFISAQAAMNWRSVRRVDPKLSNSLVVMPSSM